jgi:hypothetical protein
MHRMLAVAVLASILAAAIGGIAPESAFAQATCRNKCIEEEQACLTRTGNKGQCGTRAKSCLEKCK